jgi:hypothetical protein
VPSHACRSPLAGLPRRARSGGNIRTLEGDFLGDEAADGEPHQVDAAEAEGIHEDERVRGHLSHSVGCLSGRTADADVVERDHPATGSELVDERRVPIVEVSSEVLKEGCAAVQPANPRSESAADLATCAGG